MKKILALILLVFSSFISTECPADTVRVYGSPGEGYTDVTTDAKGDVIRETLYGEDGVIRKHKEINSDGITQTTAYRDGKPSTREAVDEDGWTREHIVYDEEGRVHFREVTDEDMNSVRERYGYDEKGRVTGVSTLSPAGEIQESILFEYDEKGRLTKATRWRDNPQGELSPDGNLEFDGNGNIKGSAGNVDGLLDDVKRHSGQEFGDGNTHVTKDKAGNTVMVRHNPDGSYDVTIINSEDRVISRQYFSAGRCYLGDECPFRHHNRRANAESLPVTVKSAELPDHAFISKDEKQSAV